MTPRPIRATTALAATLSLALGPLGAPGAAAQERVRLCLDLTQPPCPAGERRRGAPYILNADGTVVPVPRDQLTADELAEEEAPVEEAPAEDVTVEDIEAAPTEADLAADAQAEAEAAAQAEAEAAAQAQADADAAAAAEAEAAAAAEAQAEADAAVAAQAEADAAAQADADAAAAAQAQADAEAAALADAEAAAAAQAEADAAASAAAEAEAAAIAEAQAQADAAAQADADAAQAEADAQAQADADAAAAAAAQADADALAAEAAAAEAAAAEAEAVEAPAEPPAEPAEPEAPAVVAVPESDLIDPTAEEAAPAAAAAAEERAEEGEAVAAESEATPEAPAVEVVEETLAEDDVRTAEEDFGTTVTAESTEDDDDGLSDLEKVLLLGLGAVAVGSLLDDGGEVVANSGDRVVTRDARGDLQVYRDDDALLREAGATVRTETFSDGSTRSVLTRTDGSEVITIRDARGRVLRRAVAYADGTQVELFDDLAESEPVDVPALVERAPAAETVSAADVDVSALRDVLARNAVDTGRSYSLRQVREIAAVRNLVPGIDLDAITFASGSAAIRPEQIVSLVEMGALIEELLAADPAEVFLVEGHTDAVGSDATNLALSDRRAETVALALTENFEIPPENLVVQGYGERYLRVATDSDEERNRRATIRRITPLLNAVAAR